MSTLARSRNRVAALVVLAWVAGGAALALDTVEPPVVLLPNYDRILMGSQGALEGGAMICRAKAAEACWYNPAGVVRGKAPEIQGNSSLYEFNSIEANTGARTVSSSSSATLPAFMATSNRIREVGPDEGKLAWGYTIATPVNWSMDIDSYIEGDIAGGWNEITSHSQAGIETVAIGGNLGYAHSSKLAVGFGAFLYNTGIDFGKSRHDDWYATDDNWTWSSSTDTSISTTHLVFTLGLQAEPRDNMSVGLVIRTPGLALSASGSHIENRVVITEIPVPGGTPIDDNAYVESSARVEGVDVEWKVPLEIVAGIALDIGEEDQLEFNLSYHQGSGTYAVFPASTYDQRIIPAWGDPTAVTNPVRDAITTTLEDTVNFAVGYRRYVSEEKRLHFGFRTSFSPVANSPQEDLFDSVDLMVLSAGFSSLTERTMTTIGIIYQWGGASDLSLLDLEDYSEVKGDLSVRSFSLVLGASFKL